MNKLKCFAGIKIWFVLLCICNSIPAFGLEPSEILVVANKKMEGSVELARYYMDRRLVPKTNFLSLSLTLNETMTREEYENTLKKKVLKRLEKLRSQNRIAAIVLFYGVPLKVDPPRPSSEDLVSIRELKKNKKNKEDEQTIEIDRLRKTNMRAAVDSELSLVLAGQYELDGWVKNPYFLGFQQTNNLLQKKHVILVSRLDGPDVATVYRIINDSLETEQKGLQGVAYFDARWPMSKEKTLSGYKLYDQSLHKAAVNVKKRMLVVIDEQNELFPVNCCPDAALYCGWYSLANYVDSFIWKKGAIAYHIASAECGSLKTKKGSLWCLKMLEKGVAATVGPVYEPYVQGFPLPELFFGHIVEGYMSLGEAYLVSLPFLSWQMILIGDPLYQPFSPELQ